MHYTTVKNPIHLVHFEDGIVLTYTNYDQLVAGWKYIRHLNIAAQFKIEWDEIGWMCACERFYRHGGPLPARHHDYILRDSLGDNIDPADVAADVRRIENKKRHWNGYYFSSQHSRRKHAYGRFRRVRTQQERKWANAWDDEEFAPKVRPKRNIWNLPDSYCDIIAHNDKSWKTQTKRRHQWKG